MTEPAITCPTCATEIKLTESLAAPLIQATREEYDAKLARKDADIARRETALSEARADIDRDRAAISDLVETRVKAEREIVVAEEARKARALAADELKTKADEVGELRELLAQRDVKLEAAQKEQATYVRKQRELDDAKRELELTIEQRVQAAADQIQAKARDEAEQNLGLKVIEKEQQIASMAREIENLKRKAEQGSQQLQGEALELELESTLRAQFPTDVLEPVGKGENGGDVLQRVISPTGRECGSILWETKRTKNFSDQWLAKLRNDQRAAGADMAILVSKAMPKDVKAFGLSEGVWVSEFSYATALATALRQTLIAIAMARQSQIGQATKMELVYQYLTGPHFRHRVQAIVENFTAMQQDLERERKAMTRLWAKREALLQGMVASTVGMYGDLQGIAGSALQEIEGLELPLLDAPDDPDDA